jgi:hypothetical protein
LAGALCDQGVIIDSQTIDRQCGNQRAISIRILVRDFRYARQDLIGFRQSCALCDTGMLPGSRGSG